MMHIFSWIDHIGRHSNDRNFGNRVSRNMYSVLYMLFYITPLVTSQKLRDSQHCAAPYIYQNL
jgi:hypothetical protein